MKMLLFSMLLWVGGFLICFLSFVGCQSSYIFLKEFLFLDKLNTFLVFLGGCFLFLSVFSVCKESRNKLFMGLCVSLNTVMVFCFLQMKSLLFFVFFELSLFPTILLVLIWGVQPERLLASFYLLSYTALGSFPLLGCLILMNNQFYSFSFILPMYFKTQYSLGFFLMLMCFFGFFMKLPVFGLHLWLTKAHVEAPAMGSMILAGLLLKLGVYGIIRFLNFFNEKKKMFIFFFWGLFSMVVVSLMCFRSVDLKMLVAYSSVVHMGLMFVSLWKFTNNMKSSLLMLCVAHGFCSSGLFFFVKSFYQNSGSRNMLLNRGAMFMSSSAAFFWFLFTFMNASLPPSLNYFSEVILFSKIVFFNLESTAFMVFMIFLNGLFNVFLFLWMFHGKWDSLKNFWKKIKFRDSVIGIFHVMWLFILPPFLKNFL